MAHSRAGARARACARPARSPGLAPDYGPPRPHPTAGATLVAARPPLVAFNVELEPPATLEDAKRIAAAIREGGPEGLPGVRALGLQLARRSSRSRPTSRTTARTTAADVVAAVARHAPVAQAELVGLAPEAALAGLDVPLRNRRTLEDAPRLLGRGPDQTQASLQAPRQRRRQHRGARAHRPQGHARGEQEGRPRRPPPREARAAADLEQGDPSRRRGRRPAVRADPDRPLPGRRPAPGQALSSACSRC